MVITMLDKEEKISSMNNDYEKNDYKEIMVILIKALEKKFIEREELIRLSLLFLFAEQNLFLIGKPGVGKTYFCKIIFSLIQDAVFWEIQFSKGTKEKDLIELDLKSKTSIANAHYLYFDEMYKAETHLLNKLLSFLNEGYLTVNGQAYKVEKRAVFGASNELCTTVEAQAFTDRFPGTIEVQRIKTRENKLRLITKDFDNSKNMPRYFTLDEVDYIKEQASKVEISQEFSDLYIDFMNRTVEEGLKCSDRKYVNAIDLLKVSAFLNNRTYLNNSDIFIMKDVAWSDYNERTNVKRILFEIMFGNKVDIEDKLKQIETEVIKITSTKNSDYKEFLTYKYEFSGKQKEILFESVKEDISKISLLYLTQLDNLSDIANRYNEVLETEKQINENVFLTQIRNRVFTNEIVIKMNDLYNNIKENNKECEDWLLNNRILYNYEEEYFKE